MISAPKAYRIQFLDRPGQTLGEEPLRELTRELRAVGLAGGRETDEDCCARCAPRELADRVFALLRRKDGALAGFASATLLAVDPLGTVLHLGPVRLQTESADPLWTELLLARLALGFLVRHGPWSRVWVSSIASRMSVLSAVASRFESVYPSPLSSVEPREEHMQIARAIERQHRLRILLPAGARFDERAFVFRGGATDRVSPNFGAEPRPRRDQDVFTRFYAARISTAESDGVLQIGCATLLTLLRSWTRPSLPGLGEDGPPRSSRGLWPMAATS